MVTPCIQECSSRFAHLQTKALQRWKVNTKHFQVRLNSVEEWPGGLKKIKWEKTRKIKGKVEEKLLIVESPIMIYSVVSSTTIFFFQIEYSLQVVQFLDQHGGGAVPIPHPLLHRVR